jgi:hypothetical protein
MVSSRPELQLLQPRTRSKCPSRRSSRGRSCQWPVLMPRAPPNLKPQSEVICSAEKVDALPDEVLRAALEQSRKDLGEEREALWIALGDSLRLESELKKCRCDCERC